jgi:hypothetical protein
MKPAFSRSLHFAACFAVHEVRRRTLVTCTFDSNRARHQRLLLATTAFMIQANEAAVHITRVSVRNVACLLVASTLACAPRTPTSPAGSPSGLTITPARDTLFLSEQVQFVASLDGRASTTATWTSSDDRVITLGTTGLARALSGGNATVTARVDTLMAALSMRVVPEYRGRFSGLLEMTQCTRMSGGGPLHGDCEAGNRSQITISIDQQSGGAASGVLDIFGEPTVGPVSGTVGIDNHLS